jgi:hypothetical protein
VDRFSNSILWGLKLLIAIPMLAGGSLVHAEPARYDASVPYLDDATIDPRYLTTPIPTLTKGQAQVASAFASGRGLDFVELQHVTVVRSLNDDTQGSCHQKWVIALDNGQEILAIYNIDVTERIPLKAGDKMNLGGQYIWDRGGGLIHWLHEDPRNRRPDGYVELNGVRYGKFLGEEAGECGKSKNDESAPQPQYPPQNPRRRNFNR